MIQQDYFVIKGKNSGEKHEVHRQGCKHLPEPKDGILLGSFNSYVQAIVKAREKFPEIKLCESCLDYAKRMNR